ncbi:MFS transporter [Piscinibacter gummiphilus]|uniref:MFS transporter n=1 Tax=Piscinibacter gummiphilus TaxID=946333 RepID=A0ABZ0CZF2_9BURK|nr:MFS transporter [Piscinibacter gummiphilus]WOB10372.1 MFS transporter [Piscinibacter gummiphilus]
MNLAVPFPDLTLLRATIAVRAQFFIAGALFATWGIHVPTVKLHYGLGEQALAMAMLASGVGAVLTLTQAGRIVGRQGARRMAMLSGALCAGSLVALLVSQSYAVLLALMVVFGIGMSLLDVSINAAASELESLRKRNLMSGFHAMFSLGGMVGAGFGSALLSRGVDAETHLVVTSITSGVFVLLAGLVMLQTVAGSSQEGHGFSLPRGALGLLGVLAALGLIAEGAMYDWSVLYMAQELKSAPDFAALAYASFSGAMAAARFGGDWVRDRVAPAVLMSSSAALAAVSMAAVLLIAHPVATLIGFALVGLGFANVVPVLFGTAAKLDANPAHGIAVVASVGYFGMMAGPPLIGVIAEHSSLSVGLASVAVFAAILALAAPKALSPSR